MSDALPNSPFVRNVLRAARDAMAFGYTEAMVRDEMTQCLAIWVGVSLGNLDRPPGWKLESAVEIISHFSRRLVESAGLAGEGEGAAMSRDGCPLLLAEVTRATAMVKAGHVQRFFAAVSAFASGILEEIPPDVLEAELSELADTSDPRIPLDWANAAITMAAWLRAESKLNPTATLGEGTA